MKITKKNIKDIVACSAIAPFALGAFLTLGAIASHPAITMYQAYSSGFVRAYNGAVERNTNLNGKDELFFKQKLLRDIRDLSKKDHGLKQIIEQLKNYK